MHSIFKKQWRNMQLLDFTFISMHRYCVKKEIIIKISTSSRLFQYNLIIIINQKFGRFQLKIVINLILLNQPQTTIHLNYFQGRFK